jgi:methionine salvage enolase-phosphatase E1
VEEENKEGVVKLADKINLHLTGQNSLTETEKQEISTDIKDRINKSLQGGGVLRDYDNNEVLYPISLDIINIVTNVVKARRANL